MKMFNKIGVIAFLSFGFFVFYNNVCIAIGNDDGVEVDGFNILPELSDDKIKKAEDLIADIGRTGNNVWDAYNKAASGLTTSEQIATGIMNWDTIMNYLVFVVQFLSQLGLFVGALFIIYAGYKYMTNILLGSKSTPSTAVKNAIIGVIIVIFSYAIMRVLTSFIGLT